MTSDLDTRIQRPADTEAIKRLVDIEAIKTLKHRYAALLDDDYDAEGCAALFAPDAVWEGGSFGRHEGRAAIRDFFAAMPQMVSWSCHYLLNPIIEVTGDTATGQWLLWQPLVMKDGDQAMWVSARYADTYVRAPGEDGGGDSSGDREDGWLFQTVAVDIMAFSPYEEGFGKMRFMEGME